MEKDTQLELDLGTILQKKVIGRFDGGNVSSDGGAFLLPFAEKICGILSGLVGATRDCRDQRYSYHSYKDLISQRVYQIACGYEDCNDSDDLRSDPVFKSICQRLPEDGSDLGSQPTMSRLENGISRTSLYRMALSFIDCFTASYTEIPDAIILDVDDTDSPTHGAQQLSLFNRYYDEHCYMPLHIYEGRSGKLITTILRPGKRAKGHEIVAILKRVVKRIRGAWPNTAIMLRGDSHFSTPEVHEWCESEDIDFVLGQAPNKKLKELGETLLQRAKGLFEHRKEKVRLFDSFEYQAASWRKPLRIIYKAEVTPQGSNPRFVVTSFSSSRASFIYDTIYCGRGQAENYIKEHKLHLHSDRASCSRFEANQFRLFLHGAAYVLLDTIRRIGLKGTKYAQAQFNTIQNKVLKIGVRIEEMVTRIVAHFPFSYPFKEYLSRVIRRLSMASP